MARITVEDCLDNESNRFSLVRLACQRAKQLLAGSSPVTDTRGNRPIVSALREIAAGKVRFIPEVEEIIVPTKAVEEEEAAADSSEPSSQESADEPEAEKESEVN